jgi:hypothetical protein
LKQHVAAPVAVTGLPIGFWTEIVFLPQLAPHSGPRVLVVGVVVGAQGEPEPFEVVVARNAPVGSSSCLYGWEQECDENRDHRDDDP